MYEDQLKKLQNVGMCLTVPKSVLDSVLKHISKHLNHTRARARGDVDIFDLDSFFLFVNDQKYRNFFIDVFEREFSGHACSLVSMHEMIKSMIKSRWQSYPSIYFSGRHYQLINFYGIV